MTGFSGLVADLSRRSVSRLRDHSAVLHRYQRNAHPAWRLERADNPGWPLQRRDGEGL